MAEMGIEIQIHHHDLPVGSAHPKVDMNPLDQLMRSLATYVRDTWIAAVSGTVLPGMSGPVSDQKYAQAIRVVKHGDYHYAVEAEYADLHKVELGYPAYDMKPHLLASPKAKPTKDGQGVYITVPMRGFTQARGGGIRPSANPDGSDTMPPEIHQYTKAFGRHAPGTNEGQRTKIPIIQHNGQAVGGVNLAALEHGLPGPMTGSYTWKSGQWEGLTNVKTSGGASRYMTFRRVSTYRMIQLSDGRIVWKGSDPASWIHPGKRPNAVSKAVEDYTRPEIAAALAKLFGEGG